MFKVSDINGVKVIICDEKDAKNIDKISQNTVQTWQPDRDNVETISDTKQGKIAENIIEKYFNLSFNGLEYLSYDEIRNDNLKLHAPFDALIFDKNKIHKSQIDKIKELINNDVKLHNGRKISESLRKLLRSLNIYTLEVKSTKISERRKFLSDKDRIQQIKFDDFFIYPYHLRKSNTIDNFPKYVQYLKDKFPEQFHNLSDKDIVSKILNNEYKNSNDIMVRIYTDLENNKFYLMGYMSNVKILENKNIKRFYKEGKSESAIYFSRPIRDGKSIDILMTDKSFWKDNVNQKQQNNRSDLDER